METEPQVSLGHPSGLHPENVVIVDGASGASKSIQDHAAPQQPGMLGTKIDIYSSYAIS